MNEVIKVAVVQMACENGNVPRNLPHDEKFVERAATHGAELVLLPELTPNGFIMTEYGNHDLMRGIPEPHRLRRRRLTY